MRADLDQRNIIRLLWAAVLVLCGLFPLMHRPIAAAASGHPAVGDLPARWEGRPVRPLALGEVEQRFADRFPGRIARLTDGQQVIVLRDVHRPTRMLHPAADCYRGLGYRIDQVRLEADAQQRTWRCFIAERNGQRLRVCERIVDARGRAHTDTSAWFWEASLGRSAGPWQAVTVARTW